MVGLTRFVRKKSKKSPKTETKTPVNEEKFETPTAPQEEKFHLPRRPSPTNLFQYDASKKYGGVEHILSPGSKGLTVKDNNLLSDALWIPNQVSSLTEFSDKSSNLKMRDEFFDCKVQHLLDHFLSESETTSVEKLTETLTKILGACQQRIEATDEDDPVYWIVAAKDGSFIDSLFKFVASPSWRDDPTNEVEGLPDSVRSKFDKARSGKGHNGKVMNFESFFSSSSDESDMSNKLQARKIGLLILNTVCLLPANRPKLYSMGLLHNLTTLLLMNPTNIIIALNITNLTFLQEDLKTEILNESPEILSNLGRVLLNLIEKVDNNNIIASDQASTQSGACGQNKIIGNPLIAVNELIANVSYHGPFQPLKLIPSTSYYEALLHKTSVKWVVASIRNLCRFENSKSVPKDTSATIATIFKQFNLCEVLSRLVYPCESADEEITQHKLSAGITKRKKRRKKHTVVKFAINNWAQSSVADFALDALSSAVSNEELRVFMRSKKINISFMAIYSSIFTTIQASSSSSSSGSSSSMSTLSRDTAQVKVKLTERAHRSEVQPFEYAVMVIATKVKIIAVLLSRSKLNYFSGMTLTHLNGTTATDASDNKPKNELGPPPRPSNEFLSSLNLVLHPASAATITSMLQKVCERTYDFDRSATYISSMGAAGGYTRQESSLQNKTQPHDISIETILTCVWSLISRNSAIFAQNGGTTLVVTLISILANHCGLLKPQRRVEISIVAKCVDCLSSLVTTAFENEIFPLSLITPCIALGASKDSYISIIGYVVKESLKELDEESEIEWMLLANSTELLAMIRSLSEKFTNKAKLDPKGTVSSEPTLPMIHKLMTATVEAHGAFPRPEDVQQNSPLVEMGSFVSENERELVKLDELDVISNTRILSMVCDESSNQYGEVTIYSSLAAAAKAFSNGSYASRHSEEVSLFTIMSTIELACIKKGFIRYDRQWKLIHKNNYNQLWDAENEFWELKEAEAWTSFMYYGGWCDDGKKKKELVHEFKKKNNLKSAEGECDNLCAIS